MNRISHKSICLWFCDVFFLNEGEVNIFLAFHLWPFVINWCFFACVDRLEVGGVLQHGCCICFRPFRR